MKTCNKCNTEKPENEFAFKNKSKGKLNAYCKECHKNYSKQHYKDNLDYYNKKSKKSTAIIIANNSELINSYKSKGCKYCPENDPCCLDFHHVDSKSKEFDIGKGKRNFSVKKIENEIQKCEVLCSNCHRKLHAGRLTK